MPSVRLGHCARSAYHPCFEDMGLHNNFPPHFYKRGNLFNTYLGHTDGPSDAAPAKSSQKTSRRNAPSLARQRVFRTTH